MSAVCEYYLSLSSPWAYMGHDRFVALAQKYKVQIVLKPCDLSKVFNVSGGLPLAKRPPQRQAYRLQEMTRWSEFLGIPLNLQPTYFPVQTDAAAKLVIATQLAHGTNAALTITGAILRGLWAEEKNIADPATLIGIANDLDYDGQTLLKSSETTSIQTEFARFTDEAISANVFGSPWFILNGESFWGQDRLDFVERTFAKL
jgi:2-hydroxychromene-2-carboxylate isomerase